MRTFVAVELSGQVKTRLAELQRQLARFDPAIRWVRPEQIHLTLKFLGEVPDRDIHAVCQAVERAAAACPGFEIRLHGTGCFPPRGAVRVVWVGVEEPTGRLAACHQACETALARLGFEPERRPFRPHLTLGRVKLGSAGSQLRREVLALADFDAGSQPVEQLAVFESQLQRAGPIYRALHHARLAGDQGNLA